MMCFADLLRRCALTLLVLAPMLAPAQPLPPTGKAAYPGTVRMHGVQGVDDIVESVKRGHHRRSRRPRARREKQPRHVDWAGFLRERLDSHGPGAPLDGLERSGWRLTFNDQPSEYFKSLETQRRIHDFSHSIGLTVGNAPGRDSRIEDVAWGSPAFAAGIAPNSTLIAVNGRAYKAQGLKDAISTAAQPGAAPIALLVKSGDLYMTHEVAYRGGLRYPRLERIEGRPDRLSTLFAPR